MPMTYREFREMVKGLGVGMDEVWRQPTEGYDFVLIGKRQGIVIPYTFEAREIILPQGDETVLEDEEIAAHIRWIEKRTGRKIGD